MTLDSLQLHIGTVNKQVARYVVGQHEATVGGDTTSCSVVSN